MLCELIILDGIPEDTIQHRNCIDNLKIWKTIGNFSLNFMF